MFESEWGLGWNPSNCNFKKRSKNLILTFNTPWHLKSFVPLRRFQWWSKSDNDIIFFFNELSAMEVAEFNGINLANTFKFRRHCGTSTSQHGFWQAETRILPISCRSVAQAVVVLAEKKLSRVLVPEMTNRQTDWQIDQLIFLDLHGNKFLETFRFSSIWLGDPLTVCTKSTFWFRRCRLPWDLAELKKVKLKGQSYSFLLWMQPCVPWFSLVHLHFLFYLGLRTIALCWWHILWRKCVLMSSKT